ncbi:hypothetical protein BKA65DRAFT_543166 [Rhexocercosporidium sp. MPI-PUGE-AT-0058]|nr:hypothetical protein BKA65DRAFT_543166 [Rhexocercosporidium sp. MPI-PUGE-AT-0058]
MITTLCATHRNKISRYSRRMSTSASGMTIKNNGVGQSFEDSGDTCTAIPKRTVGNVASLSFSINVWYCDFFSDKENKGNKLETLGNGGSDNIKEVGLFNEDRKVEGGGEMIADELSKVDLYTRVRNLVLTLISDDQKFIDGHAGVFSRRTSRTCQAHLVTTRGATPAFMKREKKALSLHCICEVCAGIPHSMHVGLKKHYLA